MQRSTKRLALAVSAVLLAAGALAGCSGDGGGGDDTSDSIAGAELEMWIQNNAFTDKVIAYGEAWAEENDVDLTITPQPADNYLPNVVLALRSNAGPDLWNGSNPTLRSLALPLEDLLSDDTLDAYHAYLQPGGGFNIGGHIIGVPITVNTQRLAYNRDLFDAAGLDPDAPPTSLDEWREDCEAIAAKTDGYCIGLPTGWSAFASQYVDSLVEVSTPNLSLNGLFNVTNGKFEMEEYGPVIEFFREAVQEGWAYPGASSLDNDTMRAAFANGEIGTFVSATWDMTELNDKYATTIDWDAAPLPTIDGGEAVQQIVTPNNPFLVSQTTKYPEAAAALIDALTSSDFIAELVADGSTMAARGDVEIDPAVFGPQYDGYAISEIDGPRLQSPANVMSIQGDTIYQAIVALILGDGDIDSTLAQYSESYQKEYDAEVADGTIDPDEYLQ